MVAFDNPPRTPEQQLALMQRAAAHERAFVAELDGRLVAFLCLKFAPMISQPAPFAEVTDLFVEERYRRRGIARALMMEPELLIADEAVSALDVSVQAQVLKLLADVQRRFELAILFITHDLRVAAQVCDRIAVMSKGEVVEHGATGDIYRAPRHEYTKALFAAAPGRGFQFGRHA